MMVSSSTMVQIWWIVHCEAFAVSVSLPCSYPGLEAAETEFSGNVNPGSSFCVDLGQHQDGLGFFPGLVGSHVNKGLPREVKGTFGMDEI